MPVDSPLSGRDCRQCVQMSVGLPTVCVTEEAFTERVSPLYKTDFPSPSALIRNLTDSLALLPADSFDAQASWRHGTKPPIACNNIRICTFPECFIRNNLCSLMKKLYTHAVSMRDGVRLEENPDTIIIRRYLGELHFISVGNAAFISLYSL
jgi:hypothetical protein